MNKQIKALLLSVLFILNVLVSAVPVLAAGGEPNVAFNVSVTEAVPGDTFTVTLSTCEMTVLGFSGGIMFEKDTLECTAITGMRAGREGVFIKDEYDDWNKMEASTVEGANTYHNEAYPGKGSVGIGIGSSEEMTFIAAEGLVTITFKVKMDAPAGDAEIILYESTTGTDAYENQNGFETKTVTINSSHTCAFDQEVVKDEALKTAANCENAALYYKSCTCGRVSSNDADIFTSGNPLGHISSTWKTSSTEHWKTCIVISCGKEISNSRGSHTDKNGDNKCDTCEYDMTPAHTCVFDKKVVKDEALKTAGNCRDKAVYYYSCSGCGNVERNDAHTFEGDKNASKHVGGTEKKGAVAATCDKEGHENDTYCLACNTKIADGAAIKPIGHDYSVLQHDATQHWQKCSRCDATTAREAHKGGEATCKNKAACSVCQTAYGELNANNHKNTEIRGAKPATEDAEGYTGDTWCTDCNTKIKTGTVIPKLDHTHTGITKHNAVAATCKSTGMKEYWTCSSSKCAGKYYSDASCTTETTREALTVEKNANNHVGGTEKKGAVAAACDKAGHEADTYCLGCKVKIADGAVINPLGHDYSALQHDATQHWQKCSRCDATTAREAHKGGEATCKNKAVCSVCQTAYGELNASNHKNTEIRDAKPATESAEGYTGDTWCTDCNTKIKTGNVVPKLDHAHTGITKHNAVKATCSATGMKEYWTCSSPKCAGKYYSDASCTIETTLENLTVPKNASNHAGGTEKKGAVAATCDTAGHEADTYCLGCKAKIADGAVINPLGHDHSDLQHNATQHWYRCYRCGSTTTREAHNGGEATCSNKAVCSVCDTAYGELNASNHKYTEVRDAKPATEDAEGYTGDTWCIDCNIRIELGTVVPKLDHTHDMVKTEAKAATHDADGNIEYYTCQKCGKVYNDKDGTRELTADEIVIKAVGHSYNTDWKSDKNNHWHECACGSKTDVAAHETELVNVKEATEAEKGYTGDKVCKVCKATVETGKEIPAIGKPVTPVIIEGQNGEWTQGTKDGLTFKFDSALVDFEKVLVDGNEIDKANYIVREGDAIVELKPEYLATLPVGQHVISIAFAAGTATAEFECIAEATPESSESDGPQSPQTGDDNNVIFWMMLLSLFTCGIVAATVSRKKRETF